ncbi:C40 family peptidase [Tatumella citrea]|uniref:Endopeptidase n=1 Tax=Tatumella citrea TaxID=53336 RepID=A0A1Y0L821_TATCI|nr:NlpC/P60 family protein [Tatumella citrea]ARU93829.1 endopeptidase [Tatumella citrea]ARU97867.1 endopeptidase [Tatumella citrea]
MIRIAVALLVLILAGCSSHAPSPDARLSDPGRVMTQLNAQLSEWHGTPYRLGGMSRRGIDCSGFVLLTFRNRFDIQLPRTTSQQSRIGTRISKKDLKPGDLVFFKTGWGEDGLHVGIYDHNNLFIHASTSRGVMRSSLNNVYWRKVFWQARRI